MHTASFILSNHAPPSLSHTPSDFSHSHSFTPICKINNAKYLQIQSKNKMMKTMIITKINSPYRRCVKV